MQLSLSLPFPAISGNHQHGINWKAKRVFTVAKVKTYRLALKSATLCDGYRGGPRFKAGLKLSVLVTMYPPDKRKRDQDNAEKVFFDACTRAGIWADDSQIKDKRVVWAEPVKGGLVHMEVKELAVTERDQMESAG